MICAYLTALQAPVYTTRDAQPSIWQKNSSKVAFLSSLAHQQHYKQSMVEMANLGAISQNISTGADDRMSVSINHSEDHHAMLQSPFESEKFQYRLENIDTKQKHFKIKSSEPKKGGKPKKQKVRYATQVLYVGNIWCLFHKYFKYGRKPLLSIGPSWPFTIGLLVFAFGALFYFLWMITMLRIVDTKLRIGFIALMITNILALFSGILQNPGIPQSIIDKILKDQLGKGSNAKKAADLESAQQPTQQPRQYTNPYSTVYYCSQCNIQKKDRSTYHCPDCDVCIENYDHHCVFFSKCIGGGNICCFWTTIVMVFGIFVAFGALAVFDAVLK